ncbi:hypothetical protein D917_05098, partial [Trichinella nativa]
MDQTNSISAHTLKGIEFLERYAAFIKDRCSVELQYASSLRLLLYYKPVGECRSYSQLATGISQTLTFASLGQKLFFECKQKYDFQVRCWIENSMKIRRASQLRLTLVSHWAFFFSPIAYSRAVVPRTTRLAGPSCKQVIALGSIRYFFSKGGIVSNGLATEQAHQLIACLAG